MDLISENVILAELVDQYPLASKVMLKHGLDFCCGGQSSLADACESLKIDINMVIDELRPCLVKAPTQSWSTAPTEELVTHILDCYHASLYENLPHLEELINRVVEAHGEKDNQSLHALKKLLFDVSGELMIVSQFTLHAQTKKGNRPSYIDAANGDIAEKIYKSFILEIENKYNLKPKTGKFGADMKVELENDGPVTIIIDTKNK